MFVLTSPTTKKEGQVLIDCFEFQELRILHLEILIQGTLPGDFKGSQFQVCLRAAESPAEGPGFQANCLAAQAVAPSIFGVGHKCHSNFLSHSTEPQILEEDETFYCRVLFAI